MTAADEAGEASLASKALFAAGIGAVAVGSAWNRLRGDDPALEGER